MKKIITLIAGIVFSLNVFSQAPDWLWAIGAGGGNGEQGFGITTDANGNVLATGYYFSSSITFGTTTLMLTGTQDIFIVKFDNNGNVIWAKSEGSTGSTYSNSIATDVNGNVFVTGMFGGASITFGTTTLTNSGGGWYDMFIVKYDPAGNVLWAKKAGGSDWDEGKGVSTDANGNVFVTGQFKSFSISFGTITLTNSGLVDAFIAKYDVNGNILWAKKGGGGSNDYGFSISTDASGNAFITGSISGFYSVFDSDTLVPTGSPSIFIVKYDPSGNLLWAKSPTGGGAGLGITADGNGNAVATGWFGGPLSFGTFMLTSAGASDMFIVKYDGNGNELWAISGGGTSDETPLGITIDASGNVITTGGFASQSVTFGTTMLTNSSSGTGDIFVVKYDGSGNLVWAKGASGTGTESGASISTDTNGDVYITGLYWMGSITFGSTTLVNAGTSDFFIAKLDHVTGIAEENNFAQKLNIFPNPSDGNLTISLPINTKNSTLEIYTVLGEKMFIENIDNTVNKDINLTNFSNGVYFVKVTAGEKIYKEKLIIKKD